MIHNNPSLGYILYFFSWSLILHRNVNELFFMRHISTCVTTPICLLRCICTFLIPFFLSAVRKKSFQVGIKSSIYILDALSSCLPKLFLFVQLLSNEEYAPHSSHSVSISSYFISCLVKGLKKIFAYWSHLSPPHSHRNTVLIQPSLNFDQSILFLLIRHKIQ